MLRAGGVPRGRAAPGPHLWGRAAPGAALRPSLRAAVPGRWLGAGLGLSAPRLFAAALPRGGFNGVFYS